MYPLIVVVVLIASVAAFRAFVAVAAAAILFLEPVAFPILVAMLMPVGKNHIVKRNCKEHNPVRVPRARCKAKPYVEPRNTHGIGKAAELTMLNRADKRIINRDDKKD